MDDYILQKHGVNFFGFESIDSSGKHHFHFSVVKGNGDLFLSSQGIFFKQWMTQSDYIIPLYQITDIEIKPWHNMKMKWPGKVLRIFFQDGNETKIFGVALGGNFSFKKGWQDDAYLWKEKIELMLNKKF